MPLLTPAIEGIELFDYVSFFFFEMRYDPILSFHNS
jgi:hypothetical protein